MGPAGGVVARPDAPDPLIFDLALIFVALPLLYLGVNQYVRFIVGPGEGAEEEEKTATTTAAEALRSKRWRNQEAKQRSAQEILFSGLENLGKEPFGWFFGDKPTPLYSTQVMEPLGRKAKRQAAAAGSDSGYGDFAKPIGTGMPPPPPPAQAQKGQGSRRKKPSRKERQRRSQAEREAQPAPAVLSEVALQQPPPGPPMPQTAELPPMSQPPPGPPMGMPEMSPQSGMPEMSPQAGMPQMPPPPPGMPAGMPGMPPQSGMAGMPGLPPQSGMAGMEGMPPPPGMSGMAGMEGMPPPPGMAGMGGMDGPADVGGFGTPDGFESLDGLKKPPTGKVKPEDDPELILPPSQLALARRLTGRTLSKKQLQGQLGPGGGAMNSPPQPPPQMPASMQKAMATQGQEAPAAPAAGPGDDSIVSRMMELKGILDDGLITQEEYEQKKKDIMGGV